MRLKLLKILKSVHVREVLQSKPSEGAAGVVVDTASVVTTDEIVVNSRDVVVSVFVVTSKEAAHRPSRPKEVLVHPIYDTSTLNLIVRTLDVEIIGGGVSKPVRFSLRGVDAPS